MAIHGDQAGVLQISYQWSQPLYYLQLLLRKVIIFYIPIYKVLEQPWRQFTSLKLDKCSPIPHASIKVASTSCRKPFLPILELLSLTCVFCCNFQLFFPNSVMFRDYYFPNCVMIRDYFSQCIIIRDYFINVSNTIWD